jgi:drug/metabolite transporter (DMT)-like permease
MGADKDTIQTKQAITRGYLLVVAMSIFWGLNWPIMKIALLEIPPWTFRTLTIGCAAVGILILAKAGGQKLSISKNEFLPLLVVSMLNVTGWHLGSAHGVSHMEAGRAVIVGFTMPLWANIASCLVLREKVTIQKTAALLLGLTGLFILLQPQLIAVGDKPIGVFFMLAAAMSWATGTVLLKYFKWTMPTVLLTGWQLILGSLPVIAGAIIFEPGLAIFQLSLKAILATLYVIAFPMLFCHWAWFTVVGLFPASVAAITTLLVPVIGVLSSALVLEERVGFREGAALALVSVAVGIVLLWRND